ncbi:MAG: zinc ribbon domain-containing protein [Candidatus Thorarchaeota archaeon]
MSTKIICSECGAGLAKGSTFCIKCGTKIETPNSDIAETGEFVSVDSPFASVSVDSEIELEDPVDFKDDVLEESTLPESEPEWVLEDSTDLSEETLPSLEENQEDVVKDYEDNGTVEIDPSEDLHEGMPFKEVEPPKVYAETPDFSEEVKSHLFPKGEPSITRDAVQHLFPEGRGDTSQDFIDIVVGKPKKIGITQPMQEFVAPDCPGCGKTVTGDGFVYPGYVYDTMGKARVEAGIQKLKDNEHEEGIELFEKAKLLYEHSGNEKLVAECVSLTDRGYESMAESHFVQGEIHLKEHEFEWAIVQFKKAREIYMFTTESKKRAKCSEKARTCYVEWGKLLEHEGDDLAKRGESREALTKYQHAAEKYREGENPKKLKGLEKKIRRA